MNQSGKGFFSKDFINALNILSISAMSFFALPNSPFSMKPKSPANNIWVSFFEHFFAFHLNPWTLEPSAITPVQLEMTYLFYPN